MLQTSWQTQTILRMGCSSKPKRYILIEELPRQESCKKVYITLIWEKVGICGILCSAPNKFILINMKILLEHLYSLNLEGSKAIILSYVSSSMKILVKNFYFLSLERSNEIFLKYASSVMKILLKNFYFLSFEGFKAIFVRYASSLLPEK